MGTSVRKTSDKIKKILKKAREDQPNVSIEEVIPPIFTTTLRSKKAKAYFGDNEFASFAGSGVGVFRKASSKGYNEFVGSYGLNPEEIGVVEREKIIEAILDEIEESTGEIESELLLCAFKSAVTEMLIDKNLNPASFLTRFCELFISMLVREEASESLYDEFTDLSCDDAQVPISQYAKEYVEENFANIIQEYIEGKVEITTLISQLQSIS